MIKKVCFFGIYDPKYSRSKILKQAFEQNDYQVVECNVDPRQNKGLKKYKSLIKKWNEIKDKNFDELLVCFPGHSIVWLACLLYRKKVIFDAFVSLYDSNVFDRKLYSKYHPRALYDWLLDYTSCLFANKILLDTDEHILYFIKTYGVSKNKFIYVPVSADEQVFYPRVNKISSSPFVVHFHGTFIPLQGIKYIIEAANILRHEDIMFQIVGSGQEYKLIIDLVAKLNLTNIKFIAKVPVEELPTYISNSHICLGIFGDTPKTLRVIPNKVYEYAAMGKALITADSTAITKVFTNNKDVLLCNPADGEGIAKKIKYLLTNPELRRQLGDNAYQIFSSKFQAKILGQNLILNLNENSHNITYR